jgi:hypothetical protein
VSARARVCVCVCVYLCVWVCGCVCVFCARLRMRGTIVARRVHAVLPQLVLIGKREHLLAVHRGGGVRVPERVFHRGRQRVPCEELLHWRRGRPRDLQRRGLLVSGGLPDRHDERLRRGALRHLERCGRLYVV